jgi:hypothetical protein
MGEVVLGMQDLPQDSGLIRYKVFLVISLTLFRTGTSDFSGNVQIGILAEKKSGLLL